MYVRRATDEDRDALPTLLIATIRAFGPKSYDTEQVETWAKAGERLPDDYDFDISGERFTVAVWDGAVAGFGHLAMEVGEIHAIYVHPDHARQGVGSALLTELEGYARGQKLPALTLHSSLNAVGFYKQAGYKRVGKDETASGLAVVEMEKEL